MSISPTLRAFVRQRALGKCEYCLYPESSSFFTFEIEHIIAKKHGGTKLHCK